MRRSAIGLVIACATASTAYAQGTPADGTPAEGEPAPEAVPAAAPAPAPPPATMLTAPAPMPAVMAKKPAENALYAELGGNGAWYSINYERFIRPDAAIRAGLMYMSISVTAGSGSNSASANGTWMTIPLMFEYLGVHSGSHALELGAGVSMMYFSGNASTFDATAMSSGVVPVGTATIGYRYSNPDGGFIFKAGYTPLLFVTTETKDIFHWGGMSFGYRF